MRFPKAGACEIHLATDFQNMVYEHPSFPAALKDEMYAWTREHASEERKPNDTEQQFLYKARKKAIGPFKRQLWSLDASVRDAIGATLQERFAFLMKKLNIGGTADPVKRFVTVADDRAEPVRPKRARPPGSSRRRSERRKDSRTDAFSAVLSAKCQVK